MKLKKQIKSRECIICKKEFFIKGSGKSQRGQGLRQGNCLTCSKECSRIYTRNRREILRRLEKK